MDYSVGTDNKTETTDDVSDSNDGGTKEKGGRKKGSTDQAKKEHIIWVQAAMTDAATGCCKAERSKARQQVCCKWNLPTNFVGNGTSLKLKRRTLKYETLQS
jgi:hypothetical protein